MQHDCLLKIEISLEVITSLNIDKVKEINESLFPLDYSPSFYRHLLDSTRTKGFFFKYKDNVIGVCTFVIKNIRLERDCCFTNQINPSSEKECYIMTFGILSLYRNLGLGSACIQIIEEFVIRNYKIKYFKLHVHTSNFKGVNFYKKNFYRVVGIEKDYYKNIEPSSAYVLVKNNQSFMERIL